MEVHLTTNAARSLKFDLDANKVPYTQLSPTVFKLDDSPKARTAVRLARERFGQRAVLIKESTKTEYAMKKHIPTFEEFVNESTSVSANPLYRFVETVPLNGEAMKEFLKVAWNLESKQLEEMLPHMERKRKFYASQRGGTLAPLNKRSKEMLDTFIEFTESIIKTKEEDPNYIPKEYKK